MKPKLPPKLPTNPVLPPTKEWALYTPPKALQDQYDRAMAYSWQTRPGLFGRQAVIAWYWLIVAAWTCAILALVAMAIFRVGRE